MTPPSAVAPSTIPTLSRLRATASERGRQTVRERRRILVCDVESQSLHALRVVLHGAGFEVDIARSAAQALDRSAVCLPSAAIIELVLPDGDGVEVCRRLREWSTMPVIILSAVCDEDEQVRALEAGPDDYQTNPFRPRELVARLGATLRRAQPGRAEPCVELDGLEIDLAARAVRRDGEEIHLTPIEFKLLTVPLGNRGRLLTHNALLGQVWGPAYVDARQTLRAHIANLRHKIEPAKGARLIHTEPGVGYRFADIHPPLGRGHLLAFDPTQAGRAKPARRPVLATPMVTWPDPAALRRSVLLGRRVCAGACLEQVLFELVAGFHIELAERLA